jgi:hypothetical protein
MFPSLIYFVMVVSHVETLHCNVCTRNVCTRNVLYSQRLYTQRVVFATSVHAMYVHATCCIRNVCTRNVLYSQRRVPNACIPNVLFVYVTFFVVPNDRISRGCRDVAVQRLYDHNHGYYIFVTRTVFVSPLLNRTRTR